MRKRYISLSVATVAIGAGIASYVLVNDQQKAKVKNIFYDMKNKLKQEEFNTMDKAGRPDQTPVKDKTSLENAKMVSEGSQFGVQYYNEIQSDDSIH